MSDADHYRPPEPSEDATEAMRLLGEEKPITKAQRAALHASAIETLRWAKKHRPVAYAEIIGVMKAALGAQK